MDRAKMVDVYGGALAPVLSEEDIPAQVADRRTRYVLCNLGVPSSFEDLISTNVCGLRPLRDSLVGLQLPVWAQRESILILGTFLESFLCLDGENGEVVALTPQMREEAVLIASHLETFSTINFKLTKKLQEGVKPTNRDELERTIRDVDAAALESSDMWARVVQYIVS
ncbi:SUKH-4 family immunity protein [Nonomuraea purpurea]|uniref:SUKH-4 family immunity protein n=1 Tax=Nonomuraea purpurea TaxID=1849276 RepID=A0ABV8GGJ4_9ACTN